MTEMELDRLLRVLNADRTKKIQLDADRRVVWLKLFKSRSGDDMVKAGARHIMHSKHFPDTADLNHQLQAIDNERRLEREAEARRNAVRPKVPQSEIDQIMDILGADYVNAQIKEFLPAGATPLSLVGSTEWLATWKALKARLREEADAKGAAFHARIYSTEAA